MNTKINKIRFFLLFLIIEILTMTLIVFLCLYFNLLINSTNSYPAGVYMIDKNTNWQKGDLVLVCPPKNKQFKINYNNYLERSNMCSTGTIGLLKKVVATKDDIVEVGKVIKINGIEIKNSSVRDFDHMGKRLFPCYGKYVVAADTVWILSDYNNKSFDSRYFCEVESTNVIGRAKLLIEF